MVTKVSPGRGDALSDASQSSKEPKSEMTTVNPSGLDSDCPVTFVKKKRSRGSRGRGKKVPKQTMCTNNSCHRKLHCFRFIAEPSAYNQEYADFSFDRETGKCEHYIVVKLANIPLKHIHKLITSGVYDKKPPPVVSSMINQLFNYNLIKTVRDEEILRAVNEGKLEVPEDENRGNTW